MELPPEELTKYPPGRHVLLFGDVEPLKLHRLRVDDHRGEEGVDIERGTLKWNGGKYESNLQPDSDPDIFDEFWAFSNPRT